ncbi:hypothetical protein FHE72_23640 (plasmid) [Rossellomorea vietnamensis]|uniref:YopX protein domain-containing protein n=1 Tax=Rossellomorea vietnamensis TaxID=218284 RepID=A0A6I6URN8_9BACI|nr:YopX family protein [Rossellomorea vietnamensis]QHE63987.1 hypothetical protein FHE72_23640 [Rossellomorea vietnamensis]
MNDIKIRAFDSIERKMVYGTQEIFDDMLGFRFSHFECDIPIFMRYTGLNDKNDKEIYEGDIVKGGRLRCHDGTSIHTEKVAVIFESGMFKAGSISLCSINKETEIIGNVYEG